MRKYFRKKALGRMKTFFEPLSPKKDSIVVLFDSGDSGAERQVVNWLKSHRELFRQKDLIGLELANPAPKAGAFPVLGKKDFDWTGMIRLSALKRVFPSYRPEYLLVLTATPKEGIDFLAQAVNARLRISNHASSTEGFNFTLDMPTAPIGEVLREIDVFLPKVHLEPV